MANLTTLHLRNVWLAEMSLLSLPVELRLRIYDYLPELLPNFHHNILPHNQLTPAISRVNTIIRRETLPIYATNSVFAVCIDNSPEFWKRRIDSWLAALGQPAISRIRSLQISRHWIMLQPQRWQGHAGFYVRIDRLCREAKSLKKTTPINIPETDCPIVERRHMKVTTGTYPMYVRRSP